MMRAILCGSARAVALRKSAVLLIGMMCLLLPGAGCSSSGAEPKREVRVGGPCEYRSYPGEAEIVSVNPVLPSSGEAVERFDVRFRFIPEGPIEESLGRAAQNRTFSLLPDRETSPGRAFLETFDIRPGKRLACTLRVITRGTCTPILFEFPSLTSGDATR
jgi:hypothetical protein